jgi:serine/threonine-protein kinase
VAGRFRIDALLGEGGMASVYRATDLATSRPLALKLLRAELCAIPEAASRFRREGELLQSFTHPGIVRVETFGALEDGALFLAMELLAGETLGAFMRRSRVLDPSDVAPLLAGICAPLAAAHARGIVHRDLKPENIFLARATPDAEPQVKLLDFGISKVFGSEKLTQTGQLLGTPRYMAPEQLAAEHELDARVDVYAVGVILYEALAGQPPFLGSAPSDLIVSILHGRVAPLRSVRSDLPPEVESVVARAMARAREARYATPEELANAFIGAVGRPSSPGGARAGMATAVLGSMQSTPPAYAAVSSEIAAPATLVQAPAFASAARPASIVPGPEEMAPGTLSDLPAMRGAPSAPLPVAPPASTPTPPAPSPSPAAAWHVPAGLASSPVPSRGAMPARAVYVDDVPGLARAGAGPSRLVLLLVALLAGAVSTVAALAAFGWWSRRPSPTPIVASAPAGPPTKLDARPLPVVPVLAPSPSRLPSPSPLFSPTPAMPRPSSPAPVAAEAPSATRVAVPASTGAGTRDRDARRDPSSARSLRAPAVTAAPAPPSAPAAEPPVTAASLLTEARRAFARGEPEVCSSLVERALAAGAPAITLRLQGDCFRRSGRTREALAAYQRFCRLVPDNPAITEVTALAEALGGPCP